MLLRPEAMLSLRRRGDAPSLQPTVPGHLNLSGQSIAMITVPSIDQVNWWWTCCNSYNPRATDSHYSAGDISRAHKVGACPEITEADRLLAARSSSCPPDTANWIKAVAPVINAAPSRARTPMELPPLTPGQLGRKAPPGSRRSKRQAPGPHGRWDKPILTR